MVSISALDCADIDSYFRSICPATPLLSSLSYYSLRLSVNKMHLGAMIELDKNGSLPAYTAVIRTLGTAGDKYLRLLDSLLSQTHRPNKILVYLAESYQKPKETIGIEQIIYVKKGMVAQRALTYDEVETEWMLMLDDDMAIEPDGVEKLFNAIIDTGADVCAVDGFPHHTIPFKTKLAMALLLTSVPRIGGVNLGYSVSCIGTDIYNPSPTKDYAWSTTNSGNAILCRKQDFLKISFEDDLWLDSSPYAIPEDKVMFYKMHLKGLKILTHYNSGFTHLDAGTSVTGDEREARIEYSSARNNQIFYKLYVWPNLKIGQKAAAVLLRTYQKIAMALFSIFTGRVKFHSSRVKGRADARVFLKNND